MLLKNDNYNYFERRLTLSCLKFQKKYFDQINKNPSYASYPGIINKSQTIKFVREK